MPKFIYQPLEYIPISKPVNRIGYIVDACRGKRVLDLGCWDETALSKADTPFWLHSRIAAVASNLIGIDNSSTLPDDGIQLEHSMIYRGDITNRDTVSGYEIDVIIAGELIEHLPNTIAFLQNLKSNYPGKRLICSTPNATNLSNFILGIFNRESTHQDHLNIYSYKTLTTICERTGFTQYRLLPYSVKYTEMILRQTAFKRSLVQFSERVINAIERLTPMLSGGYILDAVI